MWGIATGETSNTTRHLHSVTALLVAFLLLAVGSGAFAAGGPDVTWENPASGDNVSGSVLFNVSVDLSGNGNVTNVTFAHNVSSPGFNETIAVVSSTGNGQKFFTTTNDTATVFPTDGQKWVNATAINQSGTANWSLRTFTVDNTPPLITPRRPSNDSIVGGPFDVNATWSDATTGVTGRWYNITHDSRNFASFTLTGTLNDTVDSTTIQDGRYWVSYNATDAAGNVNESLYARTFVVDNVLPFLTPRSPGDNVVIVDEMTVAATWRNATRAMYNITNQSHGVLRAGTLNETFVTNTSLNDGPYNISFNVTDAAGNTRANVSVFNISVDNDAPVITHTTPSGGAYVTGNVSLELSAYDAGTRVVGRQYRWMDSGVGQTGWRDFNETFQTIGNLSDGTYNIDVNASDASGNEQTDSLVAVTVDNTAPTLTVRTPGNNSNVSGSFDVNATWNDVTTNVTSANYTIFYAVDDEPYAHGGLNDTVDSTSLTPGDGVYFIQYNATDFLGHTTQTGNITIRVDNTNPSLTIHHPPSDGWIRDTSPWLNVTGSDNFFDVASWNYSLDNGSTTSGFTPNDTQLSVSGEYQHNVTVWAEDHAGNVNSAALDFSLDTTQPNSTDNLELTQQNETNVKSFSPVVSRIMDSTAVGLNWSGYNESNELIDALSGVTEYEVWLRNRSFNYTTHDLNAWMHNGINNDSRNGYGVRKVLAPGNNTTSLALESGYQYQFLLSPKDQAGNGKFSNGVNVTLDTAPPQFGRTSDRNDVSPFDWTNNENVTVKATIADVAGIENGTINMTVENLTGQYSVPVSLNPGTNGSASYTVTAQNPQTFLENLTTYNVTVGAADLFGHANLSMNWSFSTDFNIPYQVNATRFDTHTDGYLGWVRDNHTVDVGCAEASGESGVKELDATYANGTVHVPANTTNPWNATLTGNGNHTYVLRCTDQAGNVNDSRNVTVAIDSRAPVQTTSSPSDGATDRNTSFTMTINFEDEDRSTGEGSGINTSASRVMLKKGVGQSGSRDSLSWTNSSVDVDLSGLDEDESYEVSGWFVDNVGHNASFSVGFRTTANASSGGGGGSSNSSSSSSRQQVQQQTLPAGSLSLSGMPSGVTVVAGLFTTRRFTVENDGARLEEGIDLSASTDGPASVSFGANGFTLSSGTSQRVRMNISVPASVDPGTSEVTVTARSDGGRKATETFAVTAMHRIIDLAFRGPPAAVNVTRGNATNVSFRVTNRGNYRAEDVAFAATTGEENLSVAAIPSRSTIRVESPVTVNISLLAGLPAGVYNVTVTAEKGEERVQHVLAVKVQPASEDERRGIREQLRSLEERFNASLEELNRSNATDVGRMRTMFRNAQDAVRQGDYARAAQLGKEINSQLPEDPVTGGVLDDVLLGILALVVLGLFAAGGYAFAVRRGVVRHPEDISAFLDVEDPGYQFERSSAWERLRHRAATVAAGITGMFRKSPQQHLDDFIDRARETAGTEGSAPGKGDADTASSSEPDRLGVEIEDV